MGDENQRRSRRIRGLDPEIPATLEEYIPIEPHLEEEATHYEVENIPQGEPQFEGHVEVIREGPPSPVNAPLTNLNVPALVDVVTPLYRRAVPHIEELPTDLVDTMPFAESMSPPAVDPSTKQSGLPFQL